MTLHNCGELSKIIQEGRLACGMKDSASCVVISSIGRKLKHLSSHRLDFVCLFVLGTNDHQLSRYQKLGF